LINNAAKSSAMKYSVLALWMMIFAGVSGFAADGEIPPPQQTVLKWYQDHAAGKGIFLDPTQVKFWDFIFEPELAGLIRKKNWGQDPLFFAQDSDVTEIETQLIEQFGGQSLVLIRFENFGEKKRLIAHLKVTDHGWRLNNIVDPLDGTSLLHHLDLDTEPADGEKKSPPIE